jgi:hypothetical protein
MKGEYKLDSVAIKKVVFDNSDGRREFTTCYLIYAKAFLFDMLQLF